MIDTESGNSLELKIRIIKGEIREEKREKEKFHDILIWCICSFIVLIIVGFYYFLIKKERRIEEIILAGVLLVVIPFLGFTYYNKYQKAKQKIEQLEKELARLKKELAEKAISNTRLE